MFDAPQGLRTFDRFAEKVAIQLNDTHPALAIPELMRMLVDLEELAWDEAWEITTRTLRLHEPHRLPEALERWPVSLLGACCRATCRSSTRSTRASSSVRPARLRRRRRALPAHVDHRGGRRAAGAHGAPRDRRQPQRQRRGRAAHRDPQDTSVFRDFHELWPEKFSNKTNGVTPRRWLLKCNPGLSPPHHRARSATGWVTDLDQLQQARPARRRRRASRERWRAVKRDNKVAARRHRSSSSTRARASRSRRPRLALRRPGQAHPRVQAAAAQRAARHHALQPHQGRPHGDDRCRARSSSAARRRPATTWPS